MNTGSETKRQLSSFWGVTAFFNPAGYRNRRDNYRIFRANTKRQGLNLAAVELAFGDHPFELSKEDAEILIQIRGQEKNLMWQKEALLNIGFKNLPQDCEKVAWLDCDILFKNDHWIQETSDLLEKYSVVQPYAQAVFLNQGVFDLEQEHILSLPIGRLEGHRAPSFMCEFIQSKGFELGHEGFSWAFRRDFITKHFLYDKLILGSADTFISRVFAGVFFDSGWARNYFNDKMISDCFQWANSLDQGIREQLGYVQGSVLHIWHGSSKERIYDLRRKVMLSSNFDPGLDVRISPEGLLEWSSEKTELHQAVKAYFHFRNEEKPSILNSMMIDEYNLMSGNLKRVKAELKKHESEYDHLKNQSFKINKKFNEALMGLALARLRLNRAGRMWARIQSLWSYRMSVFIHKLIGRNTVGAGQ